MLNINFHFAIAIGVFDDNVDNTDYSGMDAKDTFIGDFNIVFGAGEENMNIDSTGYRRDEEQVTAVSPPDKGGYTNVPRSVVLSIYILLLLAAMLYGCASHAAEVPVYQAELIRIFDVPNAKQGVAVDAHHFYVVDKRAISKHDKKTGAIVAEWPSHLDGNPLLHMDSLMEYDGRLYASHSNYPQSPMTSSIEVWAAKTMQHVATHSFGVNRGSLTWLDRHDGSWWGAFANYDKIQTGQTTAYGRTDNTQIVRFDDQFFVVESWILPQNILDRIRPMSNSGGSWGPDGYLYLTGHDHGEIYVMQLPMAGSILHQVAIVEVPVMEGQGIAWDRSDSGYYLWGINKQNTKVVQLKMPEISEIRVQQLPNSSHQSQ